MEALPNTSAYFTINMIHIKKSYNKGHNFLFQAMTEIKTYFKNQTFLEALPNTLAYFTIIIFATLKSFIVQATTFVIDQDRNKILF